MIDVFRVDTMQSALACVSPYQPAPAYTSQPADSSLYPCCTLVYQPGPPLDPVLIPATPNPGSAGYVSSAHARGSATNPQSISLPPHHPLLCGTRTHSVCRPKTNKTIACGPILLERPVPPGGELKTSRGKSRIHRWFRFSSRTVATPRGG